MRQSAEPEIFADAKISNEPKAVSFARAKLAKPKLTKLVSFRLAEADHAAYLAKVQASGMKPSTFFRDAVLANKTQVVARAKPSPTRGRLVYLMNKASNNINQLAHRANADHLAGVVSEATYTQILTELHSVAQMMKAAIKDAH